jgi:hypothetical protein
MRFLLFALLIAFFAFVHGDSVMKKTTMRIKNSKVRAGNLLPQFLFLQTHDEGGSTTINIGGGKGQLSPFEPTDYNGDDIFDGAMEDMRAPQLPWLTQDLWGCEREEEDVDVWSLESDGLQAVITPQFGGKIWNIYDKTRDREWLFKNPAHQPANIGSLKAWASGGAEWNWSPGIIGHSAFTESPVWMGELETEKGPLVRVFEFDRYNSTVWQVDMLIEDDALWVHPKIVNPTDCDLRGYWWTCVAVDAKPSTRILSPASHTAQTSRDPMRDAPWPYFSSSVENSTFTGYEHQWGVDNSYLGNILWGDFFLRVPSEIKEVDPEFTAFIAHTQEDAFAIVHGYDGDKLDGNKLFYWGINGPGRFMQDFLGGGAENREGDYAELQIGPMPTQMQNFAFDAQSSLEWTEWFSAFQSDPSIMYDVSYSKPLLEVNSWIKQAVNVQRRQEMDAFFEKYADEPVTTMLSEGMPWGALEELRRGSPLKEGLSFGFPESAMDEVRPWIQLVQNGTFLEDSLARLPLSYQISDQWYDVLVASAEKFGATWLHDLHMGTVLTERGAVEEPKTLFKSSLMKKANPLALRNLAILQDTYEEAWVLFQQAWKSLHTAEWQGDEEVYSRLVLNLATEMSFFLQTTGWEDEMAKFVDLLASNDYVYEGVKEDVFGLDAVITTQSRVRLYHDDYEQALELLSAHCFPTYGRARSDLIDMWNQGVEMEKAEELGVSYDQLSKVDAHRARVDKMPPRNIGCPYADLWCMTYW